MNGAAARPRVHVNASDAAAQTRVLSLLRPCGFALAAEPDGSADTVVIAAAATVDEALEASPVTCLSGERSLLLVADTFSPPGVRRAVRAGVRTMLRAADATSAQLGAAVRSAHDGDGRMPHEVLVRLLGTPSPAPARPRPAGPAPSLTVRQSAVLALMADGLGNADIAEVLCCSEHTVKNVIYDLTARLQVRNRAHAVARAVRKGLV
ncbi:LuxR C-terminal-related transcriptional regulator [Actinomadura sp. DC4]|uniref:helix-turn-helix transcriptional regulator n=1 Tax=Actinomadura sp. DC4 TaxID=3055069 RepID=UPI0025AF8994|nr:LuxR C-terminal-related transcriptional regulator [Actinomadura sp. DC4]MDN3356443.1 LuxR C-terminal-related transcriptional regulator [Actinomadura sp. DC4]